ncbi:MAG TPA: DUF5958 family protein, partial [Spirosoma sp.]|nr:DUF5958 family protein [Spirosoma sp.]
SVDDLLDEFSQLYEDQKRKRFVHFYYYIWYFKLDASDVEQVLTDCSIKATDPTYDYLNLHLIKTGRKGIICLSDTENPPEGGLHKPYELLLHLFKTDYQRRFELEKENPSKWWYWDLSNAEISQGILTKHQERIEEVYTDAGFRSEFATLAKLWHKNNLEKQARYSEPSSERQTHFDFITYDELTVDLLPIGNRYSPAIALVRNAVENALSIRYQLDTDLARRLTLDVIERHLQETYKSTLFQDEAL